MGLWRRRRPDLVAVLADRCGGLAGDLVMELALCCGRQDRDWQLEIWEAAQRQADDEPRGAVSPPLGPDES